MKNARLDPLSVARSRRYLCTVQINGRTPGSYLGVITATVAVL